MPIDRSVLPYYVLLIGPYENYKLNDRREVLGEPSEALTEFAEQRGVNIAIDTAAWNQFAQDAGLGPIERERHCCYILIRGDETDEQLQELIDM